MSVSTEQRGKMYTTDYQIYFKQVKTSGYISPFHDIPISLDDASGVVSMVVEIPRWTNTKLEIAADIPLNPIHQDAKIGKLRFVANMFPYHGYLWNYGAIPQTWENPDIKDENTGHKGDNEPLDIVEIGRSIAKPGDLLTVKILGCLCVIDEGKTDWKIIAIDSSDPMCEKLAEIYDVDKYFPGLLKATIQWWRYYKVPDGKPENQFAFGGHYKEKFYALKIIKRYHEHWKMLIKLEKPPDGINLTNTTVTQSKTILSKSEAEKLVTATPMFEENERPNGDVDKWLFLMQK